MQTEVEAKFLNVNYEEIRAKLKKLGAVCEQPMRLMIRNNFDYPDRRLEKVGGWIRIRDESGKITLSYKQLNDRTLHGTKEVNLVVDDFQKATDFLKAIGLRLDNYQETKRESWRLDEVEVELDEWPWIKPFVELEGHSEEDIKKVAEKLNLDWSRAIHGSVENAYQAEYNVTEAEVDSIAEIKFVAVPEWLERRRRKTA